MLKESRLETTYEPYGDGIIAILHLYSFYQDSNTSSASDLAAAIEDLKKNHQIKGIVLDLRNNSGGLLPQAVAVTGLFISKGIVVSVKDNSGQVQHLRNRKSQSMGWPSRRLDGTHKRFSCRNCRANPAGLRQGNRHRGSGNIWKRHFSNIHFRISQFWESKSQRGV